MNNLSKYNHNNIQIIKYPVITDKATKLLEKNQYTFIVDNHFNKISIKDAVEFLFKVKVTKINTSNLTKKQKRVGKNIACKSKYKKAIVTLSKGDVINLFTEN